jgi:hypothetical protein
MQIIYHKTEEDPLKSEVEGISRKIVKS